MMFLKTQFGTPYVFVGAGGGGPYVFAGTDGTSTSTVGWYETLL